MKPLSGFNYIKNNKRKVIPIGLTICFGVFLVYFLSMIIAQGIFVKDNMLLRPMQSYSGLVPVDGGTIHQNVIDSIRNNNNVEKVIPGIAQPYGTHVSMIIGSMGTGILYLQDDNIDYMMRKIGLKLMDGRNPKEGMNEIAIHWRIAANKGIKIGDKMGSEVDESDSIEGKYTVVGILDGPAVLAIASSKSSTLNKDEMLKYGLIVVPRTGRINEVNDLLSSLSTDGVFTISLKEIQDGINMRFGMMTSTVFLLEFLVIVVLCISLGNISYMNFHQRRREFGVLAAIGYSKLKLYKKIWTEMIIISITGYILGILLSITVGAALNTVIWAPKGQEVILFNLKNILLMLPIPVFVTVFSILPAVNVFKKTDPILVIEGVV